MVNEIQIHSGDIPDTPLRQRRANLSDSARRRLWKSVPDETLRAYKREWGKFLLWCEVELAAPSPCLTDTLTNWVADRCDAGHSISAISQGVAAVVFQHDQDNIAEELLPDTADAWRIVGQYKTELVDGGVRARRASIITPEELRAMVATLPKDRLGSIRDRAILATGMSSFARRSNLIRFDIGDIDFLPNGDAQLKVTRSKTDQRARGRDVVVPPGEYALSDPVSSLRELGRVMAAQGVTRGPLFRRISRTDRVLGYRLHDSYVDKLVKRTAEAAGVDPQPGTTHSAHSLRASGASAAADAGAPTALIAEQGGWSPKGTQVTIYTRSKKTDNAMRGVL